MPCIKCNADFNLLTWKMRCIECEDFHCFKCVKKQEGWVPQFVIYKSQTLLSSCSHYFCGVCLILIKRPPNRDQLMELKSKDLQQYLNKYKVSTHGLIGKSHELWWFYFNETIVIFIEKTELVELFCRISIPVRHRKPNKKFPANIGGSVPDLAAQSQHFFNNLRSKLFSLN